MAAIQFMGGMFLPISFLAFAIVFTRDRKLRFKILWAALAVVISLPIGAAALFVPTDYMTYNPEFGEHAPMFPSDPIPLVVGWLVAVFVWLIGSGLALVGVMPFTSDHPN